MGEWGTERGKWAVGVVGMASEPGLLSRAPPEPPAPRQPGAQRSRRPVNGRLHRVRRPRGPRGNAAPKSAVQGWGPSRASRPPPAPHVGGGRPTPRGNRDRTAAVERRDEV